MELVRSLEEIVESVSLIRNLRKGFFTNFYLDPIKNGLWIEKGDFYIEKYGETIFFIKKSSTFWNLYYCSVSLDDLSSNIKLFKEKYKDVFITIDFVGKENQVDMFQPVFIQNEMPIYSSLVRMSRLTPLENESPTDKVYFASEEDTKVVYEYLNKFFDPKCEQIPYFEELENFRDNDRILVTKENGKVTGFVIFELNKSTLYLRYWFVHPDFRDKKIGSLLLKRFFYEGRNTRRQIFWVIRTNENAIKRYLHYGFKEEDMYDYVYKLTK